MSPNSPDDHHLEEQEEQILAADTSNDGWQARALGMPLGDALAHIPRAREMTCTIPIGPWRAINAHIHDEGVRLGEWVRQAIIDRYLKEGGDLDVARAANIAVNHPDQYRYRR